MKYTTYERKGRCKRSVEVKPFRKKVVTLLLISFLCASVIANFFAIPKVEASTTLTFTTSTSDGYIGGSNSDYASIHDAATSIVVDTDDEIRVGQAKVGFYYVYRAFVFFDTSSLPNDATIDSAILSLYVSDIGHLDTHFNVTIQNGTSSTYPHNPLQEGDYHYQNWENNGGSRNTSSISGTGYWNITLNSDGYSMISLTSDTKLCLRSNRDIDSTTPTDEELLLFYGAEQGSGYKAKLYVTYSLAPTYSEITLTSSPEVNAKITINGTEYTTPSYVSITDGNTAHLTAESGVISGDTGYAFDRWYINGSDTYYTQTIDLAITGDTTIVVYYVEVSTIYYFYGPYNEETGYLLDENVTVDIHYDTTGYSYYSHSFNGSWSSPVSPQALYFRFIFADNSTREYWVDPSETVTEIYIFHGNVSGTQQTYTITFTDTTGVLNTYPFVTVQRYINGTLYTVEKRKVDAESKILVNAIPYRTYQLFIGAETAYSFGDLTFGTSTSITLTIKSLMFPESVIMGYRYVRCYANRDMSTGTVYAYYQDLEDDTINVTISIYFQSNNSLATSSNQTGIDEWSYSTSSLDNETDYYLTMQIYHNTFGYLTYRQVLPRLFTDGSPWDLSIFGGDDLPFNLNYLIGIFAILAVAAAFSALNTVIGLFATIVTATIIGYIGWLPLGVDILVFAFALVIIFAIVTLRRKTYS